MSTETGKCSECGEIKSCTKADDGLICEKCLAPVETTKWHENLTPGTLVADRDNELFIASHSGYGNIYDFNGNIIGKTKYLRLATEAERASLNCLEGVQS